MADYFVEGGGVLENKLGLTDPEQLRQAEENAVADITDDIYDQDFSATELDFDFLKFLHARLFGAVYPFAGQVRTVNITKPDSNIPFCMADFIAPEAERIFGELKASHYLNGLSKQQFSGSIAMLAAELNALHPFREGNGRTIRLYLQLLARNAGYLVDYAAVPHEAIIAADKQAFLGSDAKIKELYQKIVYPIPRN